MMSSLSHIPLPPFPCASGLQSEKLGRMGDVIPEYPVGMPVPAPPHRSSGLLSTRLPPRGLTESGIGPGMKDAAGAASARQDDHPLPRGLSFWLRGVTRAPELTPHCGTHSPAEVARNAVVLMNPRPPVPDTALLHDRSLDSVSKGEPSVAPTAIRIAGLMALAAALAQAFHEGLYSVRGRPGTVHICHLNR